MSKIMKKIIFNFTNLKDIILISLLKYLYHLHSVTRQKNDSYFALLPIGHLKRYTHFSVSSSRKMTHLCVTNSAEKYN